MKILSENYSIYSCYDKYLTTSSKRCTVRKIPKVKQCHLSKEQTFKINVSVFITRQPEYSMSLYILDLHISLRGQADIVIVN